MIQKQIKKPYFKFIRNKDSQYIEQPMMNMIFLYISCYKTV